MSTYQELLAQKAELDQQIAVARKAQAKQALDTVHDLIAEFGFTAQQVFPWKPVVKSVAAKYRDPLTGASWSGRGRAPKWIEGKNRAEFLVGPAKFTQPPRPSDLRQSSSPSVPLSALRPTWRAAQIAAQKGP